MIMDWLWLIVTLVSYLLIATLIITIARYRQVKKNGKHRDSKRSI